MRQKLLLLFCFGLFLFTSSLYGQSSVITGTVKNSQGNPIPAASIRVRAEKSGVIADDNGKFSIKTSEGSKLVISSIGYLTREVDAKNNMVVELADTTAGLNQVVVTALGIRRQAKAIGYATTSVSQERLTEAQATNIAAGLSGKVAGLVIITTSNGVNPQIAVRLRGDRSILGNNNALIVLDNVPVTADYFNSLNPDDIESLTVLRGANAAALYGSSAANGVVMITTKRGKNKKPEIALRHTTTLEKISFFPKLQTNFGAGSTEGSYVDPLTGYEFHVPYENQQFGPEYNGQLTSLGGPVQYVNAQGQVIDTTLQINYRYNNAIPDAFKTGVTNQDGISYSSGDESGSFYLSGQYVNTTGTVPEDKSNRTIFRMAGSRNYGIFSASASASYSRFNTNVAGPDYNQGRPFYWNVLNTPGEINIKDYSNLNNVFAQEGNYYNAYYPNPFWQIYNSRQVTQRDDIFGNLALDLKPADWVDLTYRLSVVATNTQSENTIAQVNFTPFQISDPAGAGNTASGYKSGIVPGTVSDGLSYFTTLYNEFMATFHRKFLNDDLDTKLLLGASSNLNSLRAIGLGPVSLQIPGLYNISNNLNPTLPATEGTYKYGGQSAYGSLQLGYKGFLYLEITGRNDWNSLLPVANRSFFYPGANASFVFTDAFPGIKSALPWLSFGKLRASAVKVGSTGILGAYSLNQTFAQSSGFPYDNPSFNISSTLANPNLKPENTQAQELGLQFGLLNNRITTDVAYYVTHTSDQIIPVNLSTSTGFTTAYKNVGKTTSSGWEFSVDATPLLYLGQVKFDMQVNLALTQSKVNYLIPGVDNIFIGGYTSGVGIVSAVNQPIRSLVGTDWNRDPQGRVIVDAKTGYPSANPNLKNFGNANAAAPPVQLGLHPRFQYKNFVLNIQAEYRGGYVELQNIGSAMAFTGSSAVTGVAGRGKFIYPNSVINTGSSSAPVYTPNTTVAIQDGATAGGFWTSVYNVPSAPFVVSGDFWKIREVGLDYNVPLNKKGFVKTLTIGIVARNVFTFLPKDNVYADPEYNIFGTGNAQGISNENLSPPTRIFGGTVRVTF